MIRTGRRVKEIGGSDPHSTNNVMELLAVIEGLRATPPHAAVSVHSDSSYVIDGITRHIRVWRGNGFLTTSKKPVEHRELWEELDDLAAERKTRFVKVPGHAGVRENERANDIAQAFAQGRRPKLADKETDDTETRPALALTALDGAPAAFPTYMVSDRGQISFYGAWDDCRRVVEGRRGVLYKKCKSREELEYTLEKWAARAMD